MEMVAVHSLLRFYLNRSREERGEVRRRENGNFGTLMLAHHPEDPSGFEG